MHYSVTNLILSVIIFSLVMFTHWTRFTFSNLRQHIRILEWSSKNSKVKEVNTILFFPFRKMMLLVHHRWPIFHFPWCCYPLSGGYLLQPKICIIPLFFKITDKKSSRGAHFEMRRLEANLFLFGISENRGKWRTSFEKLVRTNWAITDKKRETENIFFYAHLQWNKILNAAEKCVYWPRAVTHNHLPFQSSTSSL